MFSYSPKHIARQTPQIQYYKIGELFYGAAANELGELVDTFSEGNNHEDVGRFLKKYIDNWPDSVRINGQNGSGRLNPDEEKRLRIALGFSE